MSRNRSYCFTVNNYEGIISEADWNDLQSQGATYLIYQEEIGEQGTIHLQGYISFSQPKSMQQVCNFLPGSSCRVANGSAEQNKTYCTKEEGRLGGPYEFGTIPAQVRASSLRACEPARSDGQKLFFIFFANFFSGKKNRPPLPQG